MQFLTSKFTDPGGRSPNEDSVGYFSNGNFSAWIVADGLGGHVSGEIASAEAVKTLEKVLPECQTVDEKFVDKVFQQMNEAVLALGGPLTTAVCAFSDGKKLWYANNGDSRFLFIRNNQVLFHTNDHSLAYIAFLTGNITYEEISTHPRQNRLFHSLGNEDEFNGEYYPAIDLMPGDAFILASDGFWELVKNEEIIRSFKSAPTPEESMSTMLDILRSRLLETSDNYSVVCVMVKEG